MIRHVMLAKMRWTLLLAGVTVIVTLATVHRAHAQKGGATPPANPEILYSDSGIKVMNSDGTNVRTVVSLGRGDGANYPCWGPTGTSLVFSGGFSGVPGIYTVNLDGTNRSLVISGTASSPQWSTKTGPNGHYLIAFTDYGAPDSFGIRRLDVFLVNPDGTGLVNVTDTPSEFEGYCAWSGDGSRLYFTRRGLLMAANLGLDAGGNVFVVSEDIVWTNPGGLDLVQIEAANTYDGIVCSSLTGGKMRVYTVDLGQNPPTYRLVTMSSTGDERFPSFSPNDSQIVFHRGGSSGGTITVNLDGTGEKKIITNSLKGFAPHWKRPTPSAP